MISVPIPTYLIFNNSVDKKKLFKKISTLNQFLTKKKKKTI